MDVRSVWMAYSLGRRLIGQRTQRTCGHRYTLSGALFAGHPAKPTDDNYKTIGGLNPCAVVVDDIEAMEARVRAAGFTPGSHADYEPGRRFYFDDHDGIEYEVVSYD